MKCRFCGAELKGKVCPKCGAQAGGKKSSSAALRAEIERIHRSSIEKTELITGVSFLFIVLCVITLFLGGPMKSAASDHGSSTQQGGLLETIESLGSGSNRLMRESGTSQDNSVRSELKCASAVFGNENYDRRDIRSIEILDTLKDVPGDAWDISEDQNGSVMAWVKKNRLTIAANGKIQPNKNSSGLFAWYSNARKIELNGNLNTKNVTDMSMMFYHCDNLESIDLSDLKTKKVKSMGRMFAHCESLTRLDLEGFDTGSVTDMSRMFYQCKGLLSLDVSGFDTGKVKTMERMFESCESIPKLDVTNFKTGKVKSGRGMFFRCYAVKTIELDRERFDTSNMTDMYGMFGGCYSLTYVDVSGFNTSKVTNMSYMFKGDSELRDLDISGFDMSRVEQKKKMLTGTRYE